MKPYGGREKPIRGGRGFRTGNWKVDFHIHRKGRKLENWWEGIADVLSRSAMKQRLKRNILTDE